MFQPDKPAESLAQHVAPVEAGAHVTAVVWLGTTAAFALGDGSVLLAGEGEAKRTTAHADASILVAAGDGKRLLTGGDDGRIVETRADGAVKELAKDERGRWIDALAARADGAFVWSVGKQVTARDAKGRASVWEGPSSARGLAFAPKGYRVAAAHYNGVSLWYPGTESPIDVLEWKGSHLDVTWSKDGRFVVTSMQENTLHGWTVPGKQHMRMSGYPSKTRSMQWSGDGLWLATSGADAIIVWPFQGERGPMGKAPREAGVRPAKVSCVAFHPKAMVVAGGYDDGCVLLCRLTDASELLVRRAEKDVGPVTAMAWSADGRKLAFGTAEGSAGILTLPV